MMIATFLFSTVLVELFGSHESVVFVKSLIVVPGIFVLVPAIVATGISGVFLYKHRQDKIVDKKKKRMLYIATNGLLVLVPCAIFLNYSASSGDFDNVFYTVQGVELLAGMINLTLMGLNVRDGLNMSGRIRNASVDKNGGVR